MIWCLHVCYILCKWYWFDNQSILEIFSLCINYIFKRILNHIIWFFHIWNRFVLVSSCGLYSLSLSFIDSCSNCRESWGRKENLQFYSSIVMRFHVLTYCLEIKKVSLLSCNWFGYLCFFGRCDGGSMWAWAYYKESEGINHPWWESDGPVFHHRYQVLHSWYYSPQSFISSTLLAFYNFHLLQIYYNRHFYFYFYMKWSQILSEIVIISHIVGDSYSPNNWLPADLSSATLMLMGISSRSGCFFGKVYFWSKHDLVPELVVISDFRFRPWTFNCFNLFDRILKRPLVALTMFCLHYRKRNCWCDRHFH